MTEKFLGYALSIDCGDLLGIYQGQVSSVNAEKQTLSIIKACRNGIPCKIPEITISSPDIRGLRILKTPKELEEENRSKNADVSSSSLTSSLSSVSLSKRAAMQEQQQQQQQQQKAPAPPAPPQQPPPLMQQQYALTRDFYHSQSLDQGRRYGKDHPNDRRLTPSKKGRSRVRSVSNDDCFSAPIESFDEEFDFEKNLAKFDKRAVYEEIENSMKPDLVRNADKKSSKFINDTCRPPEAVMYKQINIPRDHMGVREYVTDSGIIVPSITEELRKRLYQTAELLGYSAERISEQCGRCVCDLVLQLIGAKYWLSPVNVRQRPSVMVLCCQENYQSAWCVNAARHLANRLVDVTVVLAQDLMPCNAVLSPIASIVTKEISLYKTTNGRLTDVRDLPCLADQPVDIIVDVVDCVVQHQMSPWYQYMVDFAQQSKAPVLAVDPAAEHPADLIDIKWSLCPILPLSLNDNFVNVYLCDLGFTEKLFSSVGVKYASPFAHHFVTALRIKK